MSTQKKGLKSCFQQQTAMTICIATLQCEATPTRPHPPLLQLGREAGQLVRSGGRAEGLDGGELSLNVLLVASKLRNLTQALLYIGVRRGTRSNSNTQGTKRKEVELTKSYLVIEIRYIYMYQCIQASDAFVKELT